MLQKKSLKSKTQKGGLFNKKHPAKYRNVTYIKSNTGFSNPEMRCSICKENLFKMRTLQIGTRAWSGEFSDTSTSQGYITEGMKGEGDSTTCLQPRFITLTLTQVINLLKQLPKGKSSDPGPSPSSGQ